MDGKRVLIVDDDPETCDLVARILAMKNYETAVAHGGPDALRTLYELQPDIVLLDLLMPQMDGFEVLKRIRELTNAPAIVISAAGNTETSVRALEIGADDYIRKPFDKADLLARMQSVLRRSAQTSPRRSSPIYTDGHLTIDLPCFKVIVAGKHIRLTPTEFRLLEYLFTNAGRTCTYEAILEYVWGGYAASQNKYIHIYISRLRKKIEKDTEKPGYLLTEHGIGYRFEKQTGK